MNTGEQIMATIGTGTSLAARFAALEAERERTWAPAQLAGNRAQRQALREAFAFDRTIGFGDRIADFTLEGTDGRPLRLADLVAGGPAVLLFFRYAECPADNIALPLYDAELADAGVPVVAISPQVPEKLDAIRVRHGLSLTLATDRDNRFARTLGLTFTPLATPEPPPPGWVGEVTGTNSWELPQTAAFIVDRDRIVRFAAISPDWLDRVEPDVILQALDRILDGDDAAPQLRAAAV
jgi:peroxiredoxin